MIGQTEAKILTRKPLFDWSNRIIPTFVQLMERTSPQILHQYLLRLSPPPSPPQATNLRRRRHNVRSQVKFPMPLTDLILRRITAATTTTTPPFQFRFNHPKPFSINTDIISNHPKTMSDQSKETDIAPGNADAAPTTNLSKSGDEKQKEPEKSTPPVPPPPEKPLPGDCCGSGCVRCVWDVYYDELEEYNNLYKAK